VREGAACEPKGDALSLDVLLACWFLFYLVCECFLDLENKNLKKNVEK